MKQKKKKKNTRQCCRLEVVNSKLIRLVWGTVLFLKKILDAKILFLECV